LVVQQTSLEERYLEWFKTYAQTNNLFLQDIWVDAIERLLAHRKKCLAKGEFPAYFAAPVGCEPWSMKLPRAIVDRVAAVASEDRTSARRFYYTALVRYAQEH
jgi:hypothetical protein